MGFVRIRTSVRPIPPAGGVYQADFLVDTGAMSSLAPSTELEKIGIEPVASREYQLADGTIRELEYGYAEFDVLGQRTVGLVLFGPAEVELRR